VAFGAPVAPEAGLSLGLILLGIACVFILALNKAWEFTLGALLHTLADMIGGLPKVRILGHDVPPWDALASGVEDVNNYVLQALAYGIAKTEAGMHAIVTWMVWVLQATADEVAGLAEDTGKAFQSIGRYLLPAIWGVATKPLWDALRHIHNVVNVTQKYPTRVIHKTVQVIAPGLKALTGRVNALEAQVEAIGAKAPTIVHEGTTIITHPGITAIPGEITKGIDSLWKRTRSFGKTLTPAGIVGLVAAATLARLGLGWLKCRNVTTTAKRLCGMNPGILENLLLGAVAVFGTIGLVRFAEDVQGVTHEFSDFAQHFWRADTTGPGGDRAIGQSGAGK
jgi:hypothetical protein